MSCMLTHLKSLINKHVIINEQGLKLGFPTGRDSATFRDKGTEVPSLSRDKGTMEQAQNLATGRDGTAYQNLGPNVGQDNHYFSVKNRDGSGQSLFFPIMISKKFCYALFYHLFKF